MCKLLCVYAAYGYVRERNALARYNRSHPITHGCAVGCSLAPGKAVCGCFRLPPSSHCHFKRSQWPNSHGDMTIIHTYTHIITLAQTCAKTQTENSLRPKCCVSFSF